MTTRQLRRGRTSPSNKFKYTWSNGELTCDAAALRTESNQLDDQQSRALRDARRHGHHGDDRGDLRAAAKYRRGVTERFYWYAGAAWFQNFFAGIDDRYIVGAGVGYTFVKNDRHLSREKSARI